MVRMFVTRIAVIALAVVGTSIAAQEPQLANIPIPIMVTDFTGAAISGARIRFDDSSTGARTAVVTDQAGEATVNLPPGNYSVRTSAQGFTTWVQKYEAQTLSAVPLVFRLTVASDGGPIVVAGPTIEPDPEPPLTELIPLQSLDSLAVAGQRPHRSASLLRKHGRPKNPAGPTQPEPSKTQAGS